MLSATAFAVGAELRFGWNQRWRGCLRFERIVRVPREPAKAAVVTATEVCARDRVLQPDETNLVAAKARR